MTITAEQGTGLPATDPAMFRRLIDLGIALSAEHHHPKLMEMILLEAKRMHRHVSRPWNLVLGGNNTNIGFCAVDPLDQLNCLAVGGWR